MGITEELYSVQGVKDKSMYHFIGSCLGLGHIYA